MYSEHLNLTTLNALLQTTQMGKSSVPNEVWDEIDSTNTRATQLAADGAPHGVIVAARQQNAGRGRQGRVWVSPPDAGLYISFLLRPQIALQQLPLISLGVGVAVARAVHNTCGIEVGLKWVNDVVYAHRKLGGILAEMPDRNALIIGIGINVRKDVGTQTAELAGRAISLEEIVGAPVDVNQLAAALAFQVEQSYISLAARETTRTVEEWKRHAVTLGQEIRATVGGELVEGVARDIAPDGSLIVATPNGDRSLHAGEISIRNADGSYA